MSKIDHCATMRNNLIAAALGLQQCTKTAANIVPLPGTERFIAIGTPADVERLLATQSAKQGAQPSPPITPKHIEKISDVLLWPVTEDDARTARDMLQSLHFDLSMAEHAAATQAAPEQAEPVAYVNGDELDNMLDDRTATIQGTRSGWRKTPLYRAAPAAQVQADVREAVRDAVAQALNGVYYCRRVWSAWSVGTMREDDFTPAAEVDEVLDEITDAAIEAMKSKRAASTDGE